MGGNMFDNTSSIKKEDVLNTLKNYFTELGNIFPEKKKIFWKFKIVGSAGKKAISGDIDIAIDEKYFITSYTKTEIEKWNIDYNQWIKTFTKLKNRARTATIEQLQIKALLLLIAQKINDTSKIIITNVKKTGKGTLFSSAPQSTSGNVQIDWMVGNIQWLKFSLYSDVLKDDSVVKGLHRTQLILSLFDAKEYAFRHIDGITNKKTKEIEAKTPLEACQLLTKLYNTTIEESDLLNYFHLHDLIKLKLSSEDYDHVINIYLKILDKTRCDIPEDLQDIWLEKKEKLNLTGKFLPVTSQLLN